MRAPAQPGKKILSDLADGREKEAGAAGSTSRASSHKGGHGVHPLRSGLPELKKLEWRRYKVGLPKAPQHRPVECWGALRAAQPTERRSQCRPSRLSPAGIESVGWAAE